MTPKDFKEQWTDDKFQLRPLSFSRLEKFNLSAATIDFLTVAGLPAAVEPGLSFVDNSDDNFYGINKLTDKYDLFEEKAAYEKYVVIGSCRDGDVIAINTGRNDLIEQLDHEDLFNPQYFNSSIETLADCIILYREFELLVMKDKDADDGMQLFNFTDEQFEDFKSKLLLIDEKAVTERGFWNTELEILLGIRQQEFGTKV